MAEEGFKRKLAAILSADAVGYSRLMAEDEAATVKTLATCREVMASLIRQHRGRLVDSPGDNVLAVFSSVVDAVQCDLKIIEGHAMPDYIDTCISIPPKYSVANAIGFLKGKSAIRLHREFGSMGMGKHFWIRGYNVSTLGLDEGQIRIYIREQEEFDRQQMELELR